MKIIDKTSQQDANGNIHLLARIQGTLKYGLGWYPELQAQKKVIEQLERLLEKGFVLIRNFTLPNSEIFIPIILIGTGGVWVVYVTHVKGNFEAKGDQWNVVNNDGKALPASINYLTRAAQLATVFQKFLKIQKVEMPAPVEAVLIAADPGAQIDALRPIARVVRSDAIRQFATSLIQARPLWRPDFTHQLAERILDPTPPEELKPLSPIAAAAPARSAAFSGAEDSLASELGFAFEEEGEGEDSVP
ncbi:MAG: NERD domain-containing protein, partial [Chloroflexi bacterium]|nr:NERD domain-containing protein [Chloroflexota bacterium]